MERLVFIVLLLICNIAHAQQITVEGHVTDATTGEKLAYATVYSTKTGRGTITNHDGDFSIQVDSTDVLRISFIGYENRSFKACDMPKRITLSPWDNNLPEVTVFAAENMLQKISKQLYKEYKKYKKERSQYFLRMNIHRANSSVFHTDTIAKKPIQELAEAFITARSMGNLRETEVVKGQYGLKTTNGLEAPMTKSAGFHHIFEAAPCIQDSRYWLRTIFPLAPNLNTNFLKQHYDIKVQALKDGKGTKYYLFDLKRKSRMRYPRGIVTGKLYVKANTLQLLRFEGQVEDVLLSVGKFLNNVDLYYLDIFINITFDHSKGYTNISNMACTMESDFMDSKSVMFNVDDIDLQTGKQIVKTNKKGKKIKVKVPKGKMLYNDMVMTIREAGFDKVLWENSNIVKRTNEENKALGIEGNDSEEIAPVVSSTSDEVVPVDSSANSTSYTPIVGVIPVKADQKTLLYRISGNGLKKDSYIVGTYPLAEAAFLDSIRGCRKVLDYVDQVCGGKHLSISVSPDSHSGYSQYDLSRLPKRKTLRDVMKWGQYTKMVSYVNKYVLREMDMSDMDMGDINNPLNNLTPVAILNLCIGAKSKRLTRNAEKSEDSNLPLDSYLQKLAVSLGKKTLYLETEAITSENSYEEQTDALMSFIDKETSQPKGNKQIKKLYSEQDVEGIYELILKSNSGELAKQYNKNLSLLKKIANIMDEGSTLFVLNVATLGGNHGLLKILKNQGYNVIGVTSDSNE